MQLYDTISAISTAPGIGGIGIIRISGKDAIEIVDKKAVIGDKCTACGSCVDACPVKAIDVKMFD